MIVPGRNDDDDAAAADPDAEDDDGGGGGGGTIGFFSIMPVTEGQAYRSEGLIIACSSRR